MFSVLPTAQLTGGFVATGGADDFPLPNFPCSGAARAQKINAVFSVRPPGHPRPLPGEVQTLALLKKQHTRLRCAVP